MKNRSFIVFLGFCLILFNGCASLIVNEKVKLTCADPKASIYVSGVAKDKAEKALIYKHRPVVVTTYRRGHRPKSVLLKPNKLDVGVLLTAGFWGTVLAVEPDVSPAIYGGLFTFLDVKSSTFRHPRAINAEGPTPYAMNTENDLYVFASSRLDSLKINKADIGSYKKVNKYKKSRSRVEMDYEKNLYVTGWLNSRLEALGYQQRQPELITNYNNTCQIDFEILGARKSILRATAKNIELDLKFFICDAFGKRLKEFEVTGKSQDFTEASYFGSSDDEILQDAIFDGLMSFLNSDVWLSSKKNILAMLESETSNWESLSLTKPLIKNPDFYEFVNSQVTVITESDTYHGSGCMISPDGYLLASYRVVEEKDSFDVAFSDGSIKKATIVRRDPLSNVVLAHVDTLGNAAVQLLGKKGYEFGDKVFSVGSPVSKSLSQSLFSGIVSGYHVQNGLNYIQTDVKVSNGNNGSPLINERGELIGVINEKYIGYSFEGISFAVSSFDILERLKLNYK